MTGSLRRMLVGSRAQGRAVGAFTCYETTTAIGVVRAAESASVAAVFLVSKASFVAPGGDLLASALLAIAEAANVPVCVQLDHVDDLAVIKRALDLGVGAIMADGSKLPFEDNLAFVREATVLARSSGAHVEAELGHIEGGEDVAATAHAGALTDPTEAAEFVRETGVDCLAVSIGNVHGISAALPDLDWKRLESIRTLIDTPLSLHGASGLPTADVRRAVSMGICKVNVNAELRRRAFKVLDEQLSDASDGYRMVDLQQSLATAAEDVVRHQLSLLSGSTAAV